MCLSNLPLRRRAGCPARPWPQAYSDPTPRRASASRWRRPPTSSSRFDEIVAEFGRAHPGDTVEVVTASGKFATQIRQGRALRPVFSPPTSPTRALSRPRASPTAATRPYALGRIVLWSATRRPRMLELKDLADPARPHRHRHPPRPYGKRAEEQLKRAAGVMGSGAAAPGAGREHRPDRAVRADRQRRGGHHRAVAGAQPDAGAQGGYHLIDASLHAPLEQGASCSPAAAGKPPPRLLPSSSAASPRARCCGATASSCRPCPRGGERGRAVACRIATCVAPRPVASRDTRIATCVAPTKAVASRDMRDRSLAPRRSPKNVASRERRRDRNSTGCPRRRRVCGVRRAQWARRGPRARAAATILPPSFTHHAHPERRRLVRHPSSPWNSPRPAPRCCCCSARRWRGGWRVRARAGRAWWGACRVAAGAAADGDRLLPAGGDGAERPVGGSPRRSASACCRSAFAGLVVGSVVYRCPSSCSRSPTPSRPSGAARLEVAATLRAGPWDRFFNVALPLARPGSSPPPSPGFAHTVGEFGVVLMIGGNIPERTRWSRWRSTTTSRR